MSKLDLAIIAAVIFGGAVLIEGGHRSDRRTGAGRQPVMRVPARRARTTTTCRTARPASRSWRVWRRSAL